MDMIGTETCLPDPKFWSGKRVFLTGHTGFKGSWLTLWLQRMGAEVFGYSLPPESTPSLFKVLGLHKVDGSVFGDVRDLTDLRLAATAANPDIIIHMAAQSLVRRSYLEPVETYSTNVMGTVHVLEVAREIENLGALLVVTSDKCYENREWLWGYREDEALGGQDPYSNSKGCAELVTKAYRSSYFETSKIGVATARSGNVVGGGDWSDDRLIPDILHALEEQKDVQIRNPHATRPWQHVLEPLSGYLCLIEKLFGNNQNFTGGWNFGPEDVDVKSVGWIVEHLCELWGGRSSWSLDRADAPHEANQLKLDISKVKTKMNWVPRWRLESTLQSIVEWHKAYLGGCDMISFTHDQIASYSRSR